MEHVNNNNKHKRKTCMKTRTYKWSQKISLETENESHPFQERSLDCVEL